MKKILLLPIALVIFSTSGFTQIRKLKSTQVPEILAEGFRIKFGNIKPTDWIYDSSCICYKAHFIKKTNECSASFTEEGRWLRSETELDESTIPQVIMDAFKSSDYKDWSIASIMRVETINISSGCQFNLKKKKEQYYLIFDLNGKLLSQGKLRN